MGWGVGEGKPPHSLRKTDISNPPISLRKTDISNPPISLRKIEISDPPDFENCVTKNSDPGSYSPVLNTYLLV